MVFYEFVAAFRISEHVIINNVQMMEEIRVHCANIK